MKKKISCFLIAVLCIAVFFGGGNAITVNAAAKPEIVLTSYSVSDDYVLGEETFVEATFKNMSADFDCSSILITFNSANQSVLPSIGHSNQLFIKGLAAGQEEMVRIPVVINDRGDGYATLTFNVEYAIENVTEGTTENIRSNIKANINEYINEINEENAVENIVNSIPGNIRNSIAEGISNKIAESMDASIAKYKLDDIRVYSSSSYIVFPLGDESVTVRNVNVTTETTIGANSLVSVSFENQLKTDITNARLIISGDVNDGEISYQIGNVLARSTKYAEYYLNFTSAGQKSIKLQLKYTSDKGEEVVKDVGEYIINVNQGVSQNGGISLSAEELQKLQGQTGSALSLSTVFLVLGGLMLIVAVVVFIVYLLKRKND